MAQDYNQTLNLPKTDFPMRAGLPQREPGEVERWDKENLYRKMIEHNEGKPLYVFHDGPPYANASIHLGTALNKVLKDIIVRYKNMSGYKAAYVPGWDTHGLPIELRAIKKIGLDAVSNPVHLRKHCKEFALQHVEIQKKQFKRLGTLADYDHPYLTLAPEFEAKQIEIFGEMAKKNYIYKGQKAVHWCPTCVTALAEAELEYAEDPCDSIYVKMQVTKDPNGILKKMGVEDGSNNTYLIIWTTTSWTLPGNLAVCVGPDFTYAAVNVKGETYIIARELLEDTMRSAGIDEYQILGQAMGRDLEYLGYAHPFLDRESFVIVGDHVTLESGTGCVHTAPGHGEEDFEVCQNYAEIPVITPVDKNGVMTADAGPFQGLTTEKANGAILDRLRETGRLLAVKRIEHQYPHCWRCKAPIIYRATEQWFCSVEDFKDDTVRAIEQVEFIPEWGRDRMIGMVRDRKAWCISRQRVWGVPIPIFYCDDCGKYIVNDESIQAVAGLFRTQGSDAWFAKPAGEILPEGFVCPYCGGKHFTKENDIMDVWFDSGVSHASVLDGDTWEDVTWPCDLYLEGTDQYRGWFQSSLLTSVAWRGQAPYKAVCTHGWVVDGEGRKMSKSLGNGIDPDEIVDEFGADILRLWVSSTDYHADIRISKDLLKQLSEVYRKIRNTARYILGNISDFQPDADQVTDDQLLELDRWALTKLDALLEKVHASYNRFEFHIVYHAIHNFCTIDMSNFYLDVIKDRLYVERADSAARRSAQTAIYRILRALTLMISPILPFTAEEIWKYIPQSDAYEAESVTFNDIPKAQGNIADDAFMARWDRIIAVRDEVNKGLEQARNQKQIGKSLEAKVVLKASGGEYEFLQSVLEELPAVFIVSNVAVERAQDGAALDIHVENADGRKCERCWTFSETVGRNPEHEKLCDRCAGIVGI